MSALDKKKKPGDNPLKIRFSRHVVYELKEIPERVIINSKFVFVGGHCC